MDKREAIRIMVSAAEDYKKLYAGKNHLYVYNKDNQLYSIETSFTQSAFLHLTGVETTLSAKQFYSKCISHSLSQKDFDFKTDGTTELKMKILPKLFKVSQNYKMIGTYNNSKPKLYTERLAGGQFCCMGLISSNSRFYIPNTALNEDIRDLIVTTHRIVAIYSKSISQNEYTDRLYIAKNVSINTIESYIKQIYPLP